jgi:hypothetical protein
VGERSEGVGRGVGLATLDPADIGLRNARGRRELLLPPAKLKLRSTVVASGDVQLRDNRHQPDATDRVRPLAALLRLGFASNVGLGFLDSSRSEPAREESTGVKVSRYAVARGTTATEAVMADVLSEIRSDLEKRLRELEPLIKEHAQVREALDALKGAGTWAQRAATNVPQCPDLRRPAPQPGVRGALAAVVAARKKR